MNMLSGKAYKRVPKNLEECIEENAAVSTLHYWAEKIESFGAIVFVILIIAGIIFTIIETVNMVDVNEDMAFGAFLTSALTWALYAFIEYCTYRVIALLVNAFATLLQHTIISTNIAMVRADLDPDFPKAPTTPKEAPVPPRTSLLKANEKKTNWICPHCGANNIGNYTSCEMCGKDRN
jgi:hypothetical protein